MSQHITTSLTADRPIPVGRLVSVTVSKKRTPVPLSAPRKVVPTSSGRSAEGIATIAGIFAMLIFAALATWFAVGRPPAERPGTEPLQSAEIASDSKPLLMHSSVPPANRVAITSSETIESIVAMPKAVALEPLIERVAVMPNEVAPELEIVLIDPREVVDHPILALASPVRPERPLLAPVVDVVGRPTTEAGIEKADILEAEARQGCERFGTKVDFLPLPSQAFASAGREKDKLVMVLHIAGNFEDRGFT